MTASPEEPAPIAKFVDDEMLKAAVAYKHDNILPESVIDALAMRIMPLDDTSSLNYYIINTYAYVSADTQFSLMTDFLIATVEELELRHHEHAHWWNISETRSLIDLSILHVFNKIVNILHDEGYIYAERYAKGVISEARLSKSKETVIYRLEGS